MKIFEQDSVATNRAKRELYYDEIENEQLKQERIFNLFLYSTIVIFAITGIFVIVLYAVNLGVLVTIAASVCFGGWWAAYSLIVLHAISRK